MPRVVDDGGFSHRKRRRYTVRHTVGLVAKAQRMMETDGVSLRYASYRLGVSHSLLSKWSRRPAILGSIATLKKSQCVWARSGS